MLSVRHLRKDFSSVRAVDDVSFDVARGQIFGLIGPNGAGKSTTIRMIMDIIQPDAGEILIEGRHADDATKNVTGYLPEERGLYRKNKLIDVIAYFAALKGLDRRAALAAAGPWLERFSLDGALRRNVEELSKGNQQKAQFIISVLHAPKLLVLDELFSGLDPVNQALMKDALMEFKADNRAIIFSTHMMEHAERLCDDLVMIHKGRVVLDGTPSEIKRAHGRNAVQIAFAGDGAFLASLPGVQRADVSASFAELELAAGTDGNALLADILPRVEVSSFARVEPSLHSIFIGIVGRDHELEAEETSAPVVVAPPPVLRDPRMRKSVLSLVALVLLALFVIPNAIRFPEMSTRVAALAVLVAIVVRLMQFLKLRRQLRETGGTRAGVGSDKNTGGAA